MRRILNTKQVQQTQAYYYNGRPLMFNKDSGYTFSDNEKMDDCVNYFLSLDGFELVSDKKKEKPVKDTKKEEKSPKKESKNLFAKSDKKKDKEE